MSLLWLRGARTGGGRDEAVRKGSQRARNPRVLVRQQRIGREDCEEFAHVCATSRFYTHDTRQYQNLTHSNAALAGAIGHSMTNRLNSCDTLQAAESHVVLCGDSASLAPGGLPATRGDSLSPDDVLESRIQAVYDALLCAPTREQREKCAHRLAELVSERSPERIRQMEIAKFGRAMS